MTTARKASPDELVGITEIAAMLGVVVSAVSNWRKRSVGFPEPWGVWHCGPLWRRSDIEAWYAERIASRRAIAERKLEKAQKG